MDQLDSAPKAQHPWWVKHEWLLVTAASVGLGAAIVVPFLREDNMLLCGAAFIPFAVVHYHWRGKFHRYLITCAFYWAGIGLYILMIRLGAQHLIALICSLALASLGAAFKSSRYLAEVDAEKSV